MASYWYVWLVVCAVVFGADSMSSEPNVQIALTEKGLDYVNKVLVNNLVEQVQGLAIPVVNKNRLKLYNAKVKKVDMESASFGISEGLLQLSLKLSRIAIGGRYYFRGGWFSSNDEFKAEMNDMLIVQYLSIGHNAKGQPVITNVRCSTRIRTSSYHFKNSMILSVFANLAKSYLKIKVQELVCKAISEAIQAKGNVLPSLYPDGYRLAGIPCAVVSYPITKQPIVEADYVDFMITGKVQSSCYPSNFSSNGQRFVRYIPSQDKMLSISLSDQFINLLANQYYEAGLLTVMSMTTFKSQDNSSYSVQVTIKPTSSPVIQTTVNGSSITFNAKATIDTIPLALIEEDVLVKSELFFQEEKRKLSPKLRNLRVWPVTAQAGSSSASQSKIFLDQNQILQFAKTLSESLRYMVPLPLVDAMKLVNQEVLYQHGHITLQMDVYVQV